jgi:hypothetical protein
VVQAVHQGTPESVQLPHQEAIELPSQGSQHEATQGRAAAPRAGRHNPRKSPQSATPDVRHTRGAPGLAAHNAGPRSILRRTPVPSRLVRERRPKIRKLEVLIWAVATGILGWSLWGNRFAAFSAQEQIEFALRRAYLNLLIPIAESIFFAGGALYGSRRRRREPVAMLAAFVLEFICCDDSGRGFGLGTLLTVVAAVDGSTALLDWLTVCSGGDA